MRTNMRSGRMSLWLGLLAAGGLVWLLAPRAAVAYIDSPPHTLGALCDRSTHIIVARIEKISLEKRGIIYRKVSDLKGKYPKERVRHFLGAMHGAKPEVLQRAQIGQK